MDYQEQMIVTMAAVFESPSVVVGTSCVACGKNAWSVGLTGLTDYLTDETFGIQRCNACGLLMTQPLPGGNAIGRYYPPQYRGNRHSFTGKMRSTLRRKAVEAQFPKGFRGRLLDIGCGDGSFALEMKSHGWDVSATEIDQQTVTRLGCAGIDAKLSHEAEASGFAQRFDVVSCWHVLEHVENPRQVIDWTRAHLAPNGIFQATVPNVKSLQSKVFGRQWVHLDVPRHRQHFSPATLRALLEDCGMRIDRQSNFAWEYDWFGVIQSALNLVCTRSNVLFDQLTHAPIDPARRVSMGDKIWSAALTPLLAAMSLPMIGAAALAGDGATLTFTCRAKPAMESAA